MESVEAPPREGWKVRLDVIEAAYLEAWSKINAHVEGLEGAERQQFLDDLTRPGQTNCSWTMYGASKLASMALNGSEMKAVLDRRRRAGNEWR
jgi:hypothetical protein